MAEKRNILLYVSCIASKDNKIADELSRIKKVDIEWMLSDYAFKIIKDTFVDPTIDLFASNWNKKCKNFISWFPEPNAIEIDVFTVSWENLQFYAFPPFSMILKTLVIIKKFYFKTIWKCVKRLEKLLWRIWFRIL